VGGRSGGGIAQAGHLPHKPQEAVMMLAHRVEYQNQTGMHRKAIQCTQTGRAPMVRVCTNLRCPASHLGCAAHGITHSLRAFQRLQEPGAGRSGWLLFG
jgi:hypothetical protein